MVFKFVIAVDHSGPEYNIDELTVHLIILRNFADASDAYTYMKPSIKKENGRVNIKALHKRYNNQATVQERINDSNQSLETLVYKNERAMSFEMIFLQDAVRTLEEGNIVPHVGDLVDKLWNQIQNPELNLFVEALKVQYGRNAREHRLILQDIAA